MQTSAIPKIDRTLSIKHLLKLKPCHEVKPNIVKKVTLFFYLVSSKEGYLTKNSSKILKKQDYFDFGGTSSEYNRLTGLNLSRTFQEEPCTRPPSCALYTFTIQCLCPTNFPLYRLDFPAILLP